MKKIFIETSVFIRFLTKDDKRKLQDCIRLFRRVEVGKTRPYTSNIVIQEILFVLTRIYNFSKSEVIKDIQKILELRNMSLIEKTDTKTALGLFKKHAVKYGDCLIATQVPKGVKLVTYDKDFSKIKALAVTTPAELTK